MTQVILILDGSSSMSLIKSKTIAGFNAFLVEQQASDIPTTMTLLTFHGSGIRTIYNNISISDVPPLTQETYRTEGYTNLLDAMGYALTADAVKSTLENTILVTITDGQENSSKEFTYDAIKQLIEQAEARGWSFLFLGANIETFEVAQQLGFNAHNTLDYNTSSIIDTLQSASTQVNMLKTRRAGEDYSAYGFTAEQRARAKAGS